MVVTMMIFQKLPKDRHYLHHCYCKCYCSSIVVVVVIVVQNILCFIYRDTLYT